MSQTPSAEHLAVYYTLKALWIQFNNEAQPHDLLLRVRWVLLDKEDKTPEALIGTVAESSTEITRTHALIGGNEGNIPANSRWQLSNNASNFWPGQFQLQPTVSLEINVDGVSLSNPGIQQTQHPILAGDFLAASVACANLVPLLLLRQKATHMQSEESAGRCIALYNGEGPSSLAQNQLFPELPDPLDPTDPTSGNVLDYRFGHRDSPTDALPLLLPNLQLQLYNSDNCRNSSFGSTSPSSKKLLSNHCAPLTPKTSSLRTQTINCLVLEYSQRPKLLISWRQNLSLHKTEVRPSFTEPRTKSPPKI
ncbi:hypothetical protein BDZ45DRAFT_750180 [Acephala macrosclerotiorum]|nr:hypothetical protein BDZ45DRAFT_750180 [Acephala macrosclerotiorum]